MPEHKQTQKSTESKSTVKKQTTPRIQAPISHPMAIIQRARMNPKSLTPADILQLQRTIGNRVVGRLLSEIRSSSTAQKAPVQRQEIPEEEEPLQGKMIETIQRQEIPEEEEPLQGKFESKPEIACPSCFAATIVQRQEIPEEEEPLQGKMIRTIQQQEIPEEEEPLQPKRENNTGMPDNLKAGVESLSGIDISDVRVHYNSSKPAEVGALAYTQGTNIHVSPGQERHLPHEAWHVVQQAQGRVRPTMQLKDGVPVNDDEGMEHEADVMGTKALQMPQNGQVEPSQRSSGGKATFEFVNNRPKVVQLLINKEGITAMANPDKTAMEANFRIKNRIGEMEARTLTVSLRRHWWHGLAPDSNAEEANSLMGYNVPENGIEKDVFDLASHYRQKANDAKTKLVPFDQSTTNNRDYHVNKVETERPHSYPISGNEVEECNKEFTALRDIKLMIDSGYKGDTVTTAKASTEAANKAKADVLGKLYALKVPHAKEVENRFNRLDIKPPTREVPREKGKVRWVRDPLTGLKKHPEPKN